MKHPFPQALLALACVLSPTAAHSFCGFYVASGEAKLFNHASQVVLARDGDRTVMTMSNDFQGDAQNFAVVIPVPAVLERSQIHVGERALIDHVDAYSAPRLVEYHDEDPCAMARRSKEMHFRGGLALMSAPMSDQDDMKSEGVRIEARYTIGEYDILILSAEQSDGLERWLVAHHYNVPPGASRALGTYLKLGMKFFVAKVNIAEQKKLGFTYLRPLQIAYESPKFMLPIRLGMVNADGPQELFVYALTRKGRVETTNYRNVKLPSDVEIPAFVKGEFPAFYRDLFARQTDAHDMGVVFTEYAWDMSWCDPCASAPLTPDELRGLGVFWLDEAAGPGRAPGNAVFITRIHARYDRAHFPEDLVFQETADRENFQGRYVVRNEWQGTGDCAEAKAYRQELRTRRAKQAEKLAALTGWDMMRIRQRMGVTAAWTLPSERATESVKWWDKLWGR